MPTGWTLETYHCALDLRVWWFLGHLTRYILMTKVQPVLTWPGPLYRYGAA